MRRLIIGFGIVWMLMWIGSSGAVAIGQQIKLWDDVRLDRLITCEVQPCLLGLTPGITPWEDAVQTLRAIPGSEVEEQLIRIWNDETGAARTYRGADEQHIGRIFISMRPAPLSAGWIIALYGEPCSVSYSPMENTFSLHYPDLLASGKLQGQELTPHNPIVTIQMNDPAAAETVKRNDCLRLISPGIRQSRWRGFYHLTD